MAQKKEVWVSEDGIEFAKRYEAEKHELDLVIEKIKQDPIQFRELISLPFFANDDELDIKRQAARLYEYYQWRLKKESKLTRPSKDIIAEIAEMSSR